jgi:hypothetical protein
LKTCTSRCALPQSFLFMCNSGGTFNKPYSDCKCVTPPPVGAQTDGSKWAAQAMPPLTVTSVRSAIMPRCSAGRSSFCTA